MSDIETRSVSFMSDIDMSSSATMRDTDIIASTKGNLKFLMYSIL